MNKRIKKKKQRVWFEKAVRKAKKSPEIRKHLKEMRVNAKIHS